MKGKVSKLMKSISASMLIFVAAFQEKVCAADTAWDKNPEVGKVTGDAKTIMGKIAEFVKPIAAILIFASVLLIGFEIIMNRNKADDRMNSMTSLMWVGIGTLVIAFASLIASFLFVE